jgi:phosphatidylinositol-3-phosphatase
MKSLPIALSLFALVACGSTNPDIPIDDAGGNPDGYEPGTDGGGNPDSTANKDASPPGCGTGCPTGYTCGTANGIAVCRAASGVPLFTNVMVILMENTTRATLQSAMTSGAAPKLKAMQSTYASGANYHGVAHPSLPNYLALASGDTHGVGCDCLPITGQGTCSGLNCTVLTGSCSCNQTAATIADQLETAKLSWKAFGEKMGTPCNLTDVATSGTNGGYAVRHVPFLYFDAIRTDSTRCTSHVVDFSTFDPNSPPAYSFIAPDLVHDMHDPFLGGTGNITNGDTWIGPEVDTIVKSTGYTQGGLLVVVWDEDDNSGGLTGADDPIPIFVMSPYAKSGGYSSPGKADHYSLLATIEDGLNLPRLGAKASAATPLADYFPAN